MNVKFINAKQANEAYQYKNIKRKQYKTNAAIWCNKICRQKQLTAKYISIKRINLHLVGCILEYIYDARTHKR